MLLGLLDASCLRLLTLRLSLSDLKELGAKPHVLSLEDCTVPDLTAMLTETKPDAVVFSAGAGGKGDKSRTRKVDYEGAVKVYDAMESANVRRLLYVGAMDIRDRQKPKPEWYTSEDGEAELSCRRNSQLICMQIR